MNLPIHRADMDKWERVIAMTIAASTPFVITLTTVDSYLLPKYVWLAFWTALWLFLIAVDKRGLRHPCALDWPILALLSLSLISIFLHYRTPIQIRAYGNLLLFVFLFYAFRRIWSMGASRGGKGKVFSALDRIPPAQDGGMNSKAGFALPLPPAMAIILTIVASLLSLHAILQDYGVDFAYRSGGKGDWRFLIVATLGNPEFLAGGLAIILPVILSFGLRQDRRGGKITRFLESFAITFAVLLIAACLAVTFCVGAAIGLAGALIAGIGTALCLRQSIHIPLIRGMILFLAFAFSLAWYITDNPYNSHGHSLYQEAKKSPAWFSGFGARRFNWKTTRLMMDEFPLTGIGFGNYLTVHEHYQGLNYSIQNHAHDRSYVVPVDQPHFQLLETAAEIGPIGVLILFWLAAVWIKAAIRKIQLEPHHRWFAWGAYLGVWAAAVHSLASFPFHLPASSLFVVLLASYHVSYPQNRAVNTTSTDKKWIAFVLAAIIAASSYFQFLSSKNLRIGLELNGMNSLPYLEAARFFDPYSHQVHYALALRYGELGWKQKAIESTRMALRYQEDLESHEFLHSIYLGQNNLAEAIREKTRVVELNPVYPGHRRELAALLRKAGDEKSAIIQEAATAELESQLSAK
ncbi:MAG: O-antigen ligase family protein [Candidatus Omnitrophota bacterium]